MSCNYRKATALMRRRIDVFVDTKTWPKPPKLPSFPSAFPIGAVTAGVSIPALLLLVGQLTTPPTTHGISLSEYWAWIRYFSALTSQRGLRLTEDFAKLDSHQKTILSDDFGMGIPMYWLRKKLKLQQILDGRYFIDTVAATVGATATKTAKRGPNKSPDFVAIDDSGIWHVIECKGTQSGNDYRETQLYGSKLNAGAIQQKVTVKFPAGYTGQRLACGVALAVQGDPQRTSLKVIDPVEVEEPFDVLEEYLAAAKEAAIRSSIAVGLRLSGFQISSDAVASPVGPQPSSRRVRGAREEVRQAFVRTRREAAVAEIENRSRQRPFSVGGRRYYGRVLSLDLPRPIVADDTVIRGVTVRQGVSAEALAELRSYNFPDQRGLEFAASVNAASAAMALDEEEWSAELRVGDIFIASVELVRAG